MKMNATRFWAPLFLLIFASSLKDKWSTRGLKVTRSNYTKQLVLFREFSRSKSWNICYSFHQRGLPQLAMVLLLGGDVELNPGDKWKFPCGICTKPVKINQRESSVMNATVGSIRSVVISRPLCITS